MRRLHLVLTLMCALFAANITNAADLYVVSVFDLKAESGVSQQDAVLLSNLLRKDLAATKKLTVMDRNDMDKVLKEQGENLKDCTEEGCAIRLGEILNTDKIVVGTISKLGGNYMLYAKMVDIESGAMMFAKDVQATSDASQLPKYITELAEKMAGEIKLTGKILQVNAAEILVDLGSDVGIIAGSTLVVDRKGNAILDPETKEVKGYNWNEIARLQVIGSSGASISKCQIISSSDRVQPGDRAQEYAFGGVIEQKGSIVFTIEPGEIYLVKDNTPSGKITVPEGGKLTMQLTPGAHTFSISKQGRKDWNKEVVVKAGESQELKVDLPAGQSQVKEVSGYGILVVRSNPDGATVLIDGIERGNTTYQAKQIAAGSHTVEINKALYKSYKETITVNSDDILEVFPALEPDFGKLTITSTPSGATVYINGQQKGMTPYEVERFQSGEYDLRLVKQLYHESIQKFTMKAGSQLPVSVNLPPAFGSLRITSNPTGAKVTVDEQYWGTTPVQKDTVFSGPHNVLVQMNLYNNFEKSVTVTDGKPSLIDAVLNKNFGTLSITSDPPGADIYISGRTGKLGITPYDGNINPGVYNVQIQKDLYETYEQNVTLGIGETQKISPTLVRKMGRLVVFTEPPDAEVYIDGKFIGKSPQIIKEQPTGSYEVWLKKPGFGELRKTVQVNFKEEVTVDEKLSQTAYIEKMARKKKTILYSSFVPGSGQIIASRQTAKGALYFIAFAGSSYLAYSNYSKYNDAKSAYDTAVSQYLQASVQTQIDAAFSAMNSAYSDMESYDQSHKMFLAAAGGIWAWNMIDAFIWGGGKAETFSQNLNGSRINLTAGVDRVGLTINF